MLRLMLHDAKQFLSNLRKIYALRKSASDVYVGRGVKIFGSIKNVTLSQGCVIDDGSILDLRFGGTITLGRNVTIRSGAILTPYGGSITLGDGSGVNHYTILYGHGGLEIGEHVRFAAHCTVIPANHGFDDLETPITFQPETKLGIRIGNDVWIGANCTILDGVTICDGAVIGAGSVVSKDVATRSVVAGVPARKLKER